MNKEIREKMHKVIDLCLDAKELGHDCFYHFQAHVNNFETKVHAFGWESAADPDYKKQISLKRGTNDEILKSFDEIINYLEILINSNEKEIKLQNFKRKFECIISSYNSSNIRDCDLSNLMTKMEKVFLIPTFNDEVFNFENPDVMELYKSISNERSFIKNLKVI